MDQEESSALTAVLHPPVLAAGWLRKVTWCLIIVNDKILYHGVGFREGIRGWVHDLL